MLPTLGATPVDGLLRSSKGWWLSASLGFKVLVTKTENWEGRLEFEFGKWREIELFFLNTRVPNERYGLCLSTDTFWFDVGQVI